jgi:hypothetical protein
MSASLSGCFIYDRLTSDDETWIVELDGVKYTTAEFEYHVRQIKNWYEQSYGTTNIWEGTAWDISAQAKDDAIFGMKENIALKKFAEAYGISLPPHLQNEARNEAREYRERYAAVFGRESAITEDRLTEMFGSYRLFDVAAERIGAEAYIDMDWFNYIWDEYVQLDKWDYLDIYIQSFVTHSLSDASQFFHRLATGTDFTALAAEMTGSDFISSEPELLRDFVHRFGFPSIEEAREAGNLKAGEYSAIFESWDGLYGIIYVESVGQGDGLAERRAEWLEGYVSDSRYDHTRHVFYDFMDGLNFTVNINALTSFNVDGLE